LGSNATIAICHRNISDNRKPFYQIVSPSSPFIDLRSQ